MRQPGWKRNRQTGLPSLVNPAREPRVAEKAPRARKKARVRVRRPGTRTGRDRAIPGSSYRRRSASTRSSRSDPAAGVATRPVRARSRRRENIAPIGPCSAQTTPHNPHSPAPRKIARSNQSRRIFHPRPRHQADQAQTQRHRGPNLPFADLSRHSRCHGGRSIPIPETSTGIRSA